MGSTASRIGSDRLSRVNRTKRKLSSLLLCGRTSNSNSHSSVLEIATRVKIRLTSYMVPMFYDSHQQDKVLESPINSIQNISPASVESISSAGVSSSFFCSEPMCTSSKTSESEHEGSESCNSSAKNASTSYGSQPIEEPMLGNNGSDMVSAFGPQSVMNEGGPVSSFDNILLENLDSDENSGQNHSGSDSRALLVVSDSFVSVRMFGSGLTNSGTGILVGESGDVFSGGVSEISRREARRNSGARFGATSSRHRHRRARDFPSLSLTSGLDDFGSRNQWLLDNSGDDHHHHGRNEEWRHFRSQMSERGLGGLDEAMFCASGLHRDGTCSCGSSFMGEEAGPFGTLSRVVFLAQALSEVLEELHRQPLSPSMPMLSLPAPVSVVDSFLVKSHKKMNASESGPNYGQQCYICLVDYEEGDKIRVLPCQHEYHAPCVDKWLKEVNGVCPVCRCNVCDAA